MQCELARTPPGERAAELAVREYTLLNQYRREWEAAYPFRLPRNYSYGRGFLYPNLDGADFARHGEALAALIPLNYVRLRKTNRAMEAVAACPALRHVRDLSFDTSELRNHHIPVLLGSPYLTNIRILGLGNNSIGSAGCESLAATTALPALRVLALHGNTTVKDRGLQALTGALWFANLVGLYLSNCGISPAGVIRLAGLPAVSQLRSLDIADLNRDDTTARAILDSPHLSKLARLWHPDRDLERTSSRGVPSPIRRELQPDELPARLDRRRFRVNDGYALLRAIEGEPCGRHATARLRRLAGEEHARLRRPKASEGPSTSAYSANSPATPTRRTNANSRTASWISCLHIPPALRAADRPLALLGSGYCRGFLDPVVLPATGFPLHAKRLAELMPLCHLQFDRARGAMRSVAACPQLAPVRWLAVAGSELRNADVSRDWPRRGTSTTFGCSI